MIEYGAVGTWHWNVDRDAVEFEAIAGEEIIAIFVAREFVERRWGKMASTENLLQTAKEHFHTIIDEAGHLVRIGAAQNGEIRLE
jgi:hypothetical protein